MGVDRLSSHDLLRLPDGALQELSVLLSVCEATQTWPHQILLTIGTLLPKEVPGDRIIRLLPHLPRVWSQARESYVKQWTTECEAHWDAAIKGNGAIRKVFLRAIDEEVAARLKI
eukprot:7023039-Pyramimonas_sp.AAC.1